MTCCKEQCCVRHFHAGCTGTAGRLAVSCRQCILQHTSLGRMPGLGAAHQLGRRHLRVRLLQLGQGFYISRTRSRGCQGDRLACRLLQWPSSSARVLARPLGPPLRWPCPADQTRQACKGMSTDARQGLCSGCCKQQMVNMWCKSLGQPSSAEAVAWQVACTGHGKSASAKCGFVRC